MEFLPLIWSDFLFYRKLLLISYSENSSNSIDDKFISQNLTTWSDCWSWISTFPGVYRLLCFQKRPPMSHFVEIGVKLYLLAYIHHLHRFNCIQYVLFDLVASLFMHLFQVDSLSLGKSPSHLYETALMCYHDVKMTITSKYPYHTEHLPSKYFFAQLHFWPYKVYQLLMLCGRSH